MPGVLPLVDEPVPVSGRLDSHIGSNRERVQVFTNAFAVVFYAKWCRALSLFVDLNEDGVVLVCVTSDNRFHDRQSTARAPMSAFIRSPLGKVAVEQPEVAEWRPLKTKEELRSGCYMATAF